MKVAIFLNSGTATTRTVTADKVICADGGYNLCPLTPDYIIGDSDSIVQPLDSYSIATIPTVDCKTIVQPLDSYSIVQPTTVDKNANMSFPKEIKVIKHDMHKNFTDGESSVFFARDLGASDIDFYGVLGGRYDHTLGNFAIMALANKLGISAVARETNLDIYFANGEFSVDTKQGDLISVLPYGGETLVKNYANLEYELQNLLLTPFDTRGISNISQGGCVQLSISHGSAIVFHYTHT